VHGINASFFCNRLQSFVRARDDRWWGAGAAL
jgi:hypothetical protein